MRAQTALTSGYTRFLEAGVSALESANGLGKSSAHLMY